MRDVISANLHAVNCDRGYYDVGSCESRPFEDVLNNSVGYESSDLHVIVYNAIMDITDEEFDEELFVKFMKEQDEAT